MKDRVVQFPHRYQLVPVEGETNVYDFVPVPGTITEAGTPLNKATLLSDETAALYGLTGEDATVDDVLRFGTKWKLIQSYTQAGTYEWTAPDLNNGKPYKIGVHIIGGGGSGASSKSAKRTGSTNIRASGGGSGYSRNLIIEVTPNQTYLVVVGSGGEPVSITKASSAENGNNGGTSFFNGVIALGGDGGKGLYTATSTVSHVGGANGGQGSDSTKVSANFDTAPAMGEIRVSKDPDVGTASSIGSTSPMCALNPFDGLRRLSAGGTVSLRVNEGVLSVEACQTAPVCDDGLVGGSAGYVENATSDFTITDNPTSPGSGGGGVAMILQSTSTSENTIKLTSGAGADGAVFIYV